MANFVLIGGAWIGGWAWRDTADALRAAGHRVYPVTLTGLGERVHLGSATVNLNTHIADVVNLIEFEDLNDVVLAGHSYAGIVITGVADRAGDRVSRIVYVDSAPFAAGMCSLDVFSADERTQIERQVIESGEGWKIEVPDIADLDPTGSLSDQSRELFRRKAVPHPFGSYRQPLQLFGAQQPEQEKWIIACNQMQALLAAKLPVLSFLEGPEWQVLEVATGHWPMLSTPLELARALERIV